MNTYTLNNRSITAALFVVLIVAFASVALPHFAFAQDDGDYGYSDYSSDDGSDIGSDDTGCCSTSDYGYSDYSLDDTSDDYGYSDYSPDTSDSDYGYSDYSPDTSDYGYSDYSPDTSDYGYSDYSPDTTVYDSSTPDYSYTDYGVDEYGSDTYSTGSYGSSYSQPLSIGAPSYGYSGYSGYSTPIIPSAPIVENVPAAYQQQQQQQQQQAAPTPVTNNTCVNYSCNTVTTISNSGNTTTVVPVETTPVTYPTQYTIPVSCSITASPNSVQSGQYSFLTWQSSGAISATLTNYGNVAPNGSLSVQPYGSMNYVLTVYGANGQTASCNTYVTVGSTYPSVTLSQIPYTGFDFGTVGDAIYWAMLALFALAAGYLLVYYQGGMGSFAYAMIPTRKTKTVSQTKVSHQAPVVEKKTETHAAPAPVKVATLDTLPAFTNARPTSDSMVIANDGMPRIVINRS